MRQEQEQHGPLSSAVYPLMGYSIMNVSGRVEGNLGRLSVTHVEIPFTLAARHRAYAY